MGRGGRARQQSHEDCSLVDGPIITQTKSRLTISLRFFVCSGKRPPQVVVATISSNGHFVKSRRKSRQNTERTSTSAVSLPRFYWGTDTHRRKCMSFATETRLALGRVALDQAGVAGRGVGHRVGDRSLALSGQHEFGVADAER